MKKYSKIITIIFVLMLGILFTKNVSALTHYTQIEQNVDAHIEVMEGTDYTDKANTYYTIILTKLEKGESFEDWDSAKFFMDNPEKFYTNVADRKRKIDNFIQNRINGIIATMPGSTHDERVSSYYEAVLEKKEKSLSFNDLEAADTFLLSPTSYYHDPNYFKIPSLNARYEAFKNRKIEPALTETQLKVFKHIDAMDTYSGDDPHDIRYNERDSRANKYFFEILKRFKENTDFSDITSAMEFVNNTDVYYNNDDNYNKNAFIKEYINMGKPTNTASQSQGKGKDILVVRNIGDSSGQKEIIGYSQKINGTYRLNNNPIDSLFLNITYDFSSNYKNIRGLAYDSEQTQPIIIVGYPKDVENNINNYIHFWGSATNYYLALWNRIFITGNNENGSQIFDLDAKNYFFENLSKWGVNPAGKIYGRTTAINYPYGVTGYFTGSIDNQKPTNSDYGYDYYAEIDYQNSSKNRSTGYIDTKKLIVHVVTSDGSRQGIISAKDLFNDKIVIFDSVEVIFVNAAGGKTTQRTSLSAITWYN